MTRASDPKCRDAMCKHVRSRHLLLVGGGGGCTVIRRKAIGEETQFCPCQKFVSKTI